MWQWSEGTYLIDRCVTRAGVVCLMFWENQISSASNRSLDALRDHVFKALLWKCEAVLFAPSTGQMSSPKEHYLPDDCASRHSGEHFRDKLSFGRSSVGIRWVHKLVHYWSVRARWSKYQLLLDKLNSVFGKAWLCVCLGMAPYYKP